MAVQQADIKRVRASVLEQLGSKVMIQLDRGRNRVDIQKGVIQGAYPSVFTILVDDENEKNPSPDFYRCAGRGFAPGTDHAAADRDQG